jgi:CrcB protein
MRDLLLIAMAGAAGTLCRYGVSGVAHRWFGEGFPYGTLTVNVIGCFVLAFLMQLGQTTDVIPRQYRFALTVGFLGAFTTFSTFGFETTRLLEDGAWGPAAMNIGANLVLGVLAVIGGLALARTLVGGA